MREESPVIKMILTRRSVRKYTGTPVSREHLLVLAKAGMAAPTSRDTRHLSFILVDDPDTVDKMMEGLPYAKMLATARHAVIVCSDLNVAYGGREIDYWLQDSSAAAENVLLAAHAMGLGACWTGVHPRAERVAFLRSLMNLPKNVMPLCAIAVGHPLGEEKPRDKFDPSHVYWNSWGKSE